MTEHNETMQQDRSSGQGDRGLGGNRNYPNPQKVN